MQTLDSARLKPGVTLDRLPEPAMVAAGGPAAHAKIRGRALIVWDSKAPAGTKKLDAIDTDQITPAADCVSESLETLDEKWKAGSFRYLMPDFRARVHAGQTFLIAGDRFAIGSSREMSPAGLKGVAEEVGLELVVVCGQNMGDIFRRNSFNLGLHVVQCPDAVADAREGDEFAFDPDSRDLENLTQGNGVPPGPALRERGRDSPQRRHLCGGPARVPVVGRDEAGRGFPGCLAGGGHDVTTEQIIWAHRVDKGLSRAEFKPGATLRVYADLLPASDGTAPFSIHTFNQITGGQTIFPRQAAVANDHFVFTGKDEDEKQTSIGRAFAKLHGMEKPYYATPGDGIFHFYFPEQGLVLPGQFIPGADSHSRAYGAYGAVGIGVGSTTLGFGWSTGYIYFTLAKARRVVFTGRLNPWVGGKDIVLELLRRWGAKQSQGMSVEFVDRDRQLPMVSRNTIANMMAEAEALNGIFAPDDLTLAWYRSKGLKDFPYPMVTPGAHAVYEIDETFVLGDVAPMIAKPFSPGNAFRGRGRRARAADVRQGDDRVLHERQLRRPAAGRARDPRRPAKGLTTAAREFKVFPGSGGGRAADRTAGPAPGRGVDREHAARRGRRHPPVVVRALLRTRGGRALAGTARHHDVQSQLAEPHGLRRRGLPGQPRRRRRLRAHRLHGAAERTRVGVEARGVRRLGPVLNEP